VLEGDNRGSNDFPPQRVETNLESVLLSDWNRKTTTFDVERPTLKETLEEPSFYSE
jgi:hypothetical protein